MEITGESAGEAMFQGLNQMQTDFIRLRTDMALSDDETLIELMSLNDITHTPSAFTDMRAKLNKWNNDKNFSAASNAYALRSPQSRAAITVKGRPLTKEWLVKEGHHVYTEAKKANNHSASLNALKFIAEMTGHIKGKGGVKVGVMVGQNPQGGKHSLLVDAD